MVFNESYTGAEAVLKKVSTKVGAANIAVAILGAIVTAIVTKDAHLVVSFAAGFIVGVLNLYQSLKLIRASMTLPREAIEGFIKKRYIAKFSFSILILILLIWGAKLHPLALLAGYTVTITVTLVTLLRVLRGEFKGQCSNS